VGLVAAGDDGFETPNADHGQNNEKDVDRKVIFSVECIREIDLSGRWREPRR
jgi:hypothetical protein